MDEFTREFYESLNDRAYPLTVIPDPDSGYVFVYSDLPGCMGQVESLDELQEHANEARELWIDAAVESGIRIPEPSR